MATAVATKTYKNLIDGEWFEKNEQFDVENPATREIVGRVPRCDRKDVDRAVKAARVAFESGKWPKLSAGDRGRLLYKIGQLIRDNAEEFARLESITNGKPIRETRLADVALAADCFEYYAGYTNKIHGETVPTPGNNFNYTLREPVGVVAQIIPWNFPLLMAAWKIAPALCAGNTVILKPASITPLTALKLAEIITEAGVPRGVVNVITGPGAEIGEYLASHPEVDKVAFTGETVTGRLIMQMASGTMKKVSLELGGKSPNIVFGDADLNKAVDGALFGIFFNQGQVCCAGSRLFVEESIYDEFVKRFVEKARKIRVGDPLDEKTQMGALASESQLKKVSEFVEIGQREGATLAYGGKPITNLPGYFFEPTIFTNVTNTMRIAQEEIFGPVVCVIKFKDEKDAIFQANDTIYGLASAVWTQDLTKAHRVARAIKAGTVWVNTYNQLPNEAAFGGYKQSGVGRELGVHALELYTQVKSVFVDLNEKPMGWYDN